MTEELTPPLIATTMRAIRFVAPRVLQRHALPVVQERRPARPGDARPGRRHPAAPGVRRLRAALHHVRAHRRPAPLRASSGTGAREPLRPHQGAARGAHRLREAPGLAARRSSTWRDAVERDLVAAGEAEVPSTRVGDLVDPAPAGPRSDRLHPLRLGLPGDEDAGGDPARGGQPARRPDAGPWVARPGGPERAGPRRAGRAGLGRVRAADPASGRAPCPPAPCGTPRRGAPASPAAPPARPSGGSGPLDGRLGAAGRRGGSGAACAAGSGEARPGPRAAASATASAERPAWRTRPRSRSVSQGPGRRLRVASRGEGLQAAFAAADRPAGRARLAIEGQGLAAAPAVAEGASSPRAVRQGVEAGPAVAAAAAGAPRGSAGPAPSGRDRGAGRRLVGEDEVPFRQGQRSSVARPGRRPLRARPGARRPATARPCGRRRRGAGAPSPPRHPGTARERGIR